MSVNVWAPNKDSISRGGAAVLLWAYTGGFTVGTTDNPEINGAEFVGSQEGVVVVTFKYITVPEPPLGYGWLDRSFKADENTASKRKRYSSLSAVRLILWYVYSRLSVFGLPTALGLPEKEKNPTLLDVRAGK